jgi:hypothetical protein
MATFGYFKNFNILPSKPYCTVYLPIKIKNHYSSFLGDVIDQSVQRLATDCMTGFESR